MCNLYQLKLVKLKLLDLLNNMFKVLHMLINKPHI